MSFEHMAAVAVAPIPGKLKATLNTIANYADPKTAECWPSYQTIAELTQFDRRTVIRHVKELVELGILIKIKQTNRYGNISNRYILKIGEYLIRLGYKAIKTAEGFTNYVKNMVNRPSDKTPRKPVTNDHKPSDKTPPDPTNDPDKDPVIDPPIAPQGGRSLEKNKFFIALWDLWPNHLNERKAKRAWANCIRRNPELTVECIFEEITQKIKKHQMQQRPGIFEMSLHNYLNERIYDEKKHLHQGNF